MGNRKNIYENTKKYWRKQHLSEDDFNKMSSVRNIKLTRIENSVSKNLV